MTDAERVAATWTNDELMAATEAWWRDHPRPALTTIPAPKPRLSIDELARRRRAKAEHR